MKKIMATIAAAVLALSLAGCELTDKYITSGSATSATSVETSAAESSAQSTSGDGKINLNIGSSGNEYSIKEIAKRTMDSVVEITTEAMVTGTFMSQYISEGAGSGVIISEDGYIVTNNHVIEDATKITVRLRSGDEYNAALVGTDEKSDIAVIKIDASGLQPAVIGDSDRLEVGDTVVAIGNPLGSLGGTVTNGIISALSREITIDNIKMTLLQTNAAINPGNSGGGLFNAAGELIGVVNAKSSGSDIEGLGFAIPANTAVPVINDLISYGYVKGRIDIGVTLIDINTEYLAMYYRVSTLGTYVYSVRADSDANNAGIKSGDRISTVDGKTFASAGDIEDYITGLSIGSTVSIEVVRNGEKRTVSIILTEYVPDNIITG